MNVRRQGVTRKRTRLPRHIRPADIERAVSNSDRRAVAIKFHVAGVQQINDDLGGSLSYLQTRIAHRLMHLEAWVAHTEAVLTEAAVQARFLAEGRLKTVEQVAHAKAAIAAAKAVDRKEYRADCTTWLRFAQELGTARKARAVRRITEDIEHTEQTSAPEPVSPTLASSDSAYAESPLAPGPEDQE